jgi:hypothetical protein
MPTPNNGMVIGNHSIDKVSIMTLSERCDLALAAGRTLFVYGQATDHTVAAAERHDGDDRPGHDLRPHRSEARDRLRRRPANRREIRGGGLT